MIDFVTQDLFEGTAASLRPPMNSSISNGMLSYIFGEAVLLHNSALFILTDSSSCKENGS